MAVRGRKGRPGESPLARYAREETERTRSRVEVVIGRAHPTPEELHELHRDLRRLRILVRWWARVGPISQRDAIRSLSDRLRHLARLVGSVRDLDVELELWQGIGAETSQRRAAHADPWAGFGHHLRDSARTGRELLRAALRAERDGGLFAQLDSALVGIGSAASLAALDEEMRRERRRLVKQTAKARRRSLKAPQPDLLHELRIRVRQIRYLNDLEDSLTGSPAPTFPARSARLQRRLGELHDRDVLASHLARVDPGHTTKRWGAQFHRERERLRAEVLEEIRDFHPRRHLGSPSAAPAAAPGAPKKGPRSSPARRPR